MRKALRKREGERFRVRCHVERFGTKSAFKGGPIPTILLKNLQDVTTGDNLTDHLWFTAGKWCQGLRIGDTIEFDARVGAYLKGYQGRREDVYAPVSEDFRLERPTRVIRIETQVEAA